MGRRYMRTSESPDGFALETARPGAVSAALFRCGGAPAPWDVLLERDAQESRDDASAGDERAT
jgi:hypothetical protein